VFSRISIDIFSVGSFHMTILKALLYGKFSKNNSTSPWKQRPHHQLCGVVDSEKYWSAESDPQSARNNTGKQAETCRHGKHWNQVNKHKWQM